MVHLRMSRLTTYFAVHHRLSKSRKLLLQVCHAAAAQPHPRHLVSMFGMKIEGSRPGRILLLPDSSLALRIYETHDLFTKYICLWIAQIFV